MSLGNILNNKLFLLIALTIADIFRVNYSIQERFFKDVDFHCYVSFANDIWNGVTNYKHIYCDHGMLFYPAGNAYYYALLYKITNNTARYVGIIHGIVFVATTYFILDTFLDYIIEKYSKFLPSLLRFLFLLGVIIGTQTIYRVGLSYLQNDMHLTFFIIVMFWGVKNKYYLLSSMMYAIAVSYKMNSLLYGPLLLFIYLHHLPFVKVFLHFFAMGVFQILIALRFLITDWKAYISVAYNFSRDFENQNNIAWSFLGDYRRQHQYFYRFLFAMTFVFLFSFMYLCHKIYANFKEMIKESTTEDTKQKLLEKFGEWKMFTLVAGHFLSFIFVRGLHIQFTLWLFFSFPFLLHTLFCRSHHIFGYSLERKKPVEQSTWKLILLFLLIFSIYFLFDWIMSNPANAIRPERMLEVGRLMSNGNIADALTVFNGDRIDSVFGHIGVTKEIYTIVKEQSEGKMMSLYQVIGHFYEEGGYSLRKIPPSFILFVLECLIAWKIFSRCYSTIKEQSKFIQSMKSKKR